MYEIFSHDDIAEILLNFALITNQSINQSIKAYNLLASTVSVSTIESVFF
jgi:hypothetical protein